MKKIFPSGYHPGKPGLEKVLGSLESEVMEVVWCKGDEVCVRDVLEVLNTRREIAYTTVMTIMGRLAQKKLLIRRKDGNTFFFKPSFTREQFAGQVVSSVVDDLLSDFSEATLAHFIHRVRDQDRATLERLEKMLKAVKEQEPDDVQ
jgi:predicted transcriptional regulator